MFFAVLIQDSGVLWVQGQTYDIHSCEKYVVIHLWVWILLLKCFPCLHTYVHVFLSLECLLLSSYLWFLILQGPATASPPGVTPWCPGEAPCVQVCPVTESHDMEPERCQQLPPSHVTLFCAAWQAVKQVQHRGVVKDALPLETWLWGKTQITASGSPAPSTSWHHSTVGNYVAE